MRNEVFCHLEQQQHAAQSTSAGWAADQDTSSRTMAMRGTGSEELYRAISVTYHTLRLMMAGLALALPFMLWLRSDPMVLLPSLSAYYHHDMPGGHVYGAGDSRDLFVGTLCAVGAFLLGYRGYTIEENRALNIGGIAIVLVAIFPMGWFGREGPAARIHDFSAIIFFLTIAYVCLWEAKKTLRLLKSEQQRQRFARSYEVLGGLMIGLPAILLILNLLHVPWISIAVVWLLEVSAMAVFALFWIVKSWEIRLIEREAGLTSRAAT